MGVNFFREQVRDRISRTWTLPRTYFGRSGLKGVRFRDTDLSQSNLCWNDFIDVDFSEAILEACDLRGSLFGRVKFIDADLCAADFRRSSIKACLFDGANVQGAILTRAQGVRIALSEVQRISVDWRDDEGPEPDSG